MSQQDRERPSLAAMTLLGVGVLITILGLLAAGSLLYALTWVRGLSIPGRGAGRLSADPCG